VSYQIKYFDKIKGELNKKSKLRTKFHLIYNTKN